MSSGGSSAASTRFKIFVLLAGPLLVALATGLGDSSWLPFFPGAVDPDERSLRLQAAFDRLLTRSAGVAARALQDSPASAAESARLLSDGIGGRLEGVGRLDRDLQLRSWVGTPARPPSSIAGGAGPAWAIRVDGARTRLVARAGPDERGESAVASFVIDSASAGQRFLELLPLPVRRGLDIDVTFLDTELAEPDSAAAQEGRVVILRSPAGEAMAFATLVPVAPEHRAEQLRRQGRAWALSLFLLLLAFLFRWRESCGSWGGVALATGALLLARLALVWQEVPARLLPRELGAPSLFGSSGMLGLLASPADLLLTAGLVFLLCLCIREGCRGHGVSPGAKLAAAAAAGGATASALGMTVSLARNSRVPLLAPPAPFEWDARLVLWTGLSLALLGAALLWGWLFAALRRGSAADRPESGLLHDAVALVILAGASSGLMQLVGDRLALEQLRSEFAPQLLEQEARRRIALVSAMHEIRESFASGEDRRRLAGSRPEFLAYRYWVTGELFHSRYRSSLDFYTAAADPVSHFAFGLPPLDEPIGEYAEPLDEVVIQEEVIEGDVLQRRLLHAELPVFGGEELLGVVVGHVLNEPEDLPFLPGSQPYLAALGPGLPRLATELPGGGLNYVLYAPDGTVRLTTLLRPPAATEQFLQAARGDESIRVAAGDELFRGLVLEEDDGRVHLLLLPQRTVAERLGAAVRLSLLGLVLLILLVLVPRLSGRGGLRELVHQLRVSFYRKLLAALLIASVFPLVGLALFLRGYVDRRGDAELIASATQFARTAQRVVEDYSAQSAGEEELELTDSVLHWLRRVVGQEIHVYERGDLIASSKRELFDSGLLLPRLDGEVQRRLVEEGLPYLVAPIQLGPGTIPVAYAPVRRPGAPSAERVVALPLVLEQRQIERGVSRVAELILLATVALAGLLAVAAALLARTVARPVRDLVGATARIAAGDYATRLTPKTQDEVAELVRGFNTMASALGRQRRDIERRRDYIETVLRHATTGVVSLDTEGRIVTLNPAAAALLASSASRLAEGGDLREALAASAEFAPLSEALDSGTSRSGVPVDVDLVREGEQRRLRAVRVELTRAGGKGFGTLILLDDVTELMRSNQLAAWAEMARAIAHEIKNPLTPIQLSAEHLRRLLRDRGVLPSSEENACLDTVIKQVRALYDIAGEFSSYAKLPVLSPEPTDPVEFMRRTVAPYVTSKPRGVSIEERYDPAPPIAIDRRVLSRAIINLMENALQAMDAGGRITISVAHDDDEVVLSVADTGHGLGPEVKRRLFEPYFSTKSSGTGLGLAISRRAVEVHGGRIEVESDSGRGATFRVHLPALREEAGTDPASD